MWDDINRLYLQPGGAILSSLLAFREMYQDYSTLPDKLTQIMAAQVLK
jgi:hypothetical protein